MLRTIVSAGLTIFMPGVVSGQPQAGQPSFEVASVKPAPPPVDGRMKIMMRGGPGAGDPRLMWEGVPLRMVITRAYGVKDYQVTAPDWVNSTMFNIDATMQPNTTEEQFQLMLQGLLAERFGLKMHREQKDLPMYALIVAKNGPKLKESTEDSTLPGMGRGGPMGDGQPGASGGRPIGGPADGVKATFGATVDVGGSRGGAVGGPPPGKMGRGGMMSMGRGHLAAAKMSLSGLADNLSRTLARPVLDMTGLAGRYDFTLDWTPDDNERGTAGLPAGMSKGEGGGDVHPDSVTGATLFTALQEQLGLKLDPRKAPVELIVVDHLERAPTDN
jgi:uncharacterized protein (TIGR03435 family)